MAKDEVIQRYTIDAQDSLETLKKLSADEVQLAKGLDKAGASAEDATQKIRKLSAEEEHLSITTTEAGRTAEGVSRQLSLKDRAVRSVTDGVLGMIKGWLSFAAIGGLIIDLFRSITSEAVLSAKAIVQVGASLRDLSANIGGKRAKTVFQEVTSVAAENRFNMEGRAKLLEAVTAATDVRENMTDPQIRDLSRVLGRLQRGTNQGGAAAFSAVEMMTSTYGISDDEASNKAATLFNSGLAPETMKDIVSKGASQDFLALLLESRKNGLDVNQNSRTVPTLLDALNKTDTTGKLDPKLAAAGITPEMSDVQRLQFLADQKAAGKINDFQIANLLGGEAAGRLYKPLMRTLRVPGAMDSAKASLADSQALEKEIQKVIENPYVQAQERQNLRELSRQVRLERSSLTPVGEQLLSAETETPGWGLMGKFIYHTGNLPNYVAPPDPEAEAAQIQNRIMRGGRSAAPFNGEAVGQAVPSDQGATKRPLGDALNGLIKKHRDNTREVEERINQAFGDSGVVPSLNDQTSFNDTAGLHPHVLRSLNEFTRGALNANSLETMKRQANVTININVTPINQLFQTQDPTTVFRRPHEID